MKGKIKIGYGGVELRDGMINVLTTEQPLDTLDGWDFEIQKDKVEQRENLSYIARFVLTVLHGAYVEPMQLGDAGHLKDVVFSVEDYLLSVIYDTTTGNLYPTLIRQTPETLEPIKFTYEGEFFEDFFNNIKQDIVKLLEEK